MKRIDKRILVGIGLLLLVVTAAAASAATLLVDQSGDANIDDTIIVYPSIQAAINAANPEDTISIMPGTYTESQQIVISKNLTITGTDKTTTIIKPSADTGAGGSLDDSAGWFLVNLGVTFNLNNVTLDGDGKKIKQAIRSHGPGTIQDNIIKNMGYDPSTVYDGRGIVTFDANMVIRRNVLSNIGRIGIYIGSGVTNAVIDHNTYTGKGDGNWLDYGIEVERGGHATITNNSISDNRGVANDGSTSAGILATTYFSPPGTSATITGNNIKDNTVGIAVGYEAADTTTIFAHYNNFTGNGEGINSTNATVDATNNWWGSDSGPGHVGPGTGDKVSLNVLYDPWTFTFNNVWAGWTSIGGKTDANPSLATFNGRLYAGIRGIGTAHNSFIASTDTSGIWSSWTAVPIYSTTSPAIQEFNGKLYAIVANATNDIYINSMDTAETWTGWTYIGGKTDMTPSLAVFNNKLYASVRGTGSSHNSFINSMDTNGVWSGWTSVPVYSTTGPAISTFDGKLYSMVASTDNDMYINSMDTDGIWNGWTLIGGKTDMTPSLAVYNDKLYIALRGIGLSKNTFIGTMDSVGVWSGWTPVPIYSTTGPSIARYYDKLYGQVASTSNDMYSNNLS